MRFILILSVTFLSFSSVHSQIQPLGEFDFSDGEYSLIGFIWGGSGYNKLVDSLGEWYTDDVDVLNEFKSTWIFEKPGKQYICGYHYEIHLCKNGESVKKFLLNLNCREIVTDEGYFYFNPDMMAAMKNKLQKPIAKIKKFGSISTARNYHAKILNNDSLIWTPNPLWLKFEGSFSFNYECRDKTINCLDYQEKILKKLTEEIQNQYPGEKFKLSTDGGSNTHLFIKIKCDQSLAEMFNLYPRSRNKWDPYKLILSSYWIQ